MKNMVPTFGLYVDNFFTNIIVTVHFYNSSCRIEFFVIYLEVSLKNKEESRHTMIGGHETAAFMSKIKRNL